VTSTGGFQRNLAAAGASARALWARHQFVKFVLVGIGNTCFSYGAYGLFLWLGFDFRLASLSALVLGIAVSFTTQGNLVFLNATRVTLVKFVLAWVAIYGLNILLIGLLMRAAMNAYVAGAIATVPVTLVSFFVLRYLVFGRGDPGCTAKPPG
jgi:putative flippase GtrA